jgi:hypothetical protein
MSNKDLIARIALWSAQHPGEIYLTYLAARAAPAKVGLVAVEFGTYYSRIAQPTFQLGYNISKIAIGSRGVAAVGALGTTALYAGAVGVGLAAGVVVGTAVSGAVFGSAGREKALEFYTGQANLIDYVPAYNIAKIVKHYVTT